MVVIDFQEKVVSSKVVQYLYVKWREIVKDVDDLEKETPDMDYDMYAVTRIVERSLVDVMRSQMKDGWWYELSKDNGVRINGGQVEVEEMKKIWLDLSQQFNKEKKSDEQ